MGSKIPSDRIYHSDKVLAGIPQLVDDFSQLIDDQETGMSENCISFFFTLLCSHNGNILVCAKRERWKENIKKIIYEILCSFHVVVHFAISYTPADVVFLLGREEERVYAHRLILAVRCKSFQMASGGEFSRSVEFFL